MKDSEILKYGKEGLLKILKDQRYYSLKISETDDDDNLNVSYVYIIQVQYQLFNLLLN